MWGIAGAQDLARDQHRGFSHKILPNLPARTIRGFCEHPKHQFLPTRISPQEHPSTPAQQNILPAPSAAPRALLKGPRCPRREGKHLRMAYPWENRIRGKKNVQPALITVGAEEEEEKGLPRSRVEPGIRRRSSWDGAAFSAPAPPPIRLIWLMQSPGGSGAGAASGICFTAARGRDGDVPVASTVTAGPAGLLPPALPAKNKSFGPASHSFSKSSCSGRDENPSPAAGGSSAPGPGREGHGQRVTGVRGLGRPGASRHLLTAAKLGTSPLCRR